ncbi:MAG: hypothetical protein K0R20_2614, partial [Actinomycetia bacterium]|nr:hypothetical protein [Actinomycetes bacterium]
HVRFAAYHPSTDRRSPRLRSRPSARGISRTSSAAGEATSVSSHSIHTLAGSSRSSLAPAPRHHSPGCLIGPGLREAFRKQQPGSHAVTRPRSSSRIGSRFTHRPARSTSRGNVNSRRCTTSVQVTTAEACQRRLKMSPDEASDAYPLAQVNRRRHRLGRRARCGRARSRDGRSPSRGARR